MRRAAIVYPINPPRCSAIREAVYANDRPDTDRQCSRAARYLIDGKPMCQDHAAIACLNILLMSEYLQEDAGNPSAVSDKGTGGDDA